MNKIIYILLILTCISCNPGNKEKNTENTIIESESYASDNFQEKTASMDTVPKNKVQREILGIWEDNVLNYFITILKYEDGRFEMETLFSDKSINLKQLEVKKKNGSTLYYIEGNFFEYFQIKKDGLYLYDASDNLAKKYIKYDAFEW